MISLITLKIWWESLHNFVTRKVIRLWFVKWKKLWFLHLSCYMNHVFSYFLLIEWIEYIIKPYFNINKKNRTMNIFETTHREPNAKELPDCIGIYWSYFISSYLFPLANWFVIIDRNSLLHTINDKIASFLFIAVLL